MKITAEFNSNEELLSFISTFGAKGFMPNQGVVNTVNVVAPVVEAKKIVDGEKKEDKPVEEIKGDVSKEEIKENIPTKGAEIPKEEAKEEDPKSEDPKVTKEMIRERLGVIMKAGKQKEVKDLVAKYGASKVPDLKEEDYVAIYEEAEGLL